MQRHEKELTLQTYLSAYSVAGKRGQLLDRIQFYRFVADNFVSPDTTIADVGCGEGFGAFLLAKKASRVLGIELCPAVVERAQSLYSNDRLRYECLDVFGDTRGIERSDVVCALDVIEHVRDDREFLLKLKSMTRPGGRVVVSTPNKLLSLLTTGRPYEFHEREYCFSEFAELMSRVFGSEVEMYSVCPGALSRVTLRAILSGRALRLLPAGLKDLLRRIRFRMTAPRGAEDWIAQIESAWDARHEVPIVPCGARLPSEDASDYLAVAKP